MIVILLLVIFIQHLIILYYRSEAINYRNLFELSKQYNEPIPKKRGRKPSNERQPKKPTRR